MGGPSRYVAHNYNCRVTGVDFTASRVEGARRLTRMARLHERVAFVTADALSMPFADRTFDVAISQEAFCHIPDKPLLIAQCARVLKRGGRIAFTDILKTGRTSAATEARLQREMTFQELGSVETYRQAVERAGCEVLSVEDLSERWRDILIERLAMYRGLKEQTVARFGAAHFAAWDAAYSHFVSLYETGELGGARFLARRSGGA
jgi:ubiquinone/menaquinone biosynthesis C-methylase UbiE